MVILPTGSDPAGEDRARAHAGDRHALADAGKAVPVLVGAMPALIVPADALG